MGPGTAHHPLEPSADEMRAMADLASTFLIRFIEGLPEAAASDLDDLAAAPAGFREPVPESGMPFEPLARQVLQAAEKGFTTPGPGYLAYIPGGGLWASAVADFIATGVNKFVGVWNAAPALAQIEATAVRWLCDLFGYPPEARGILTSGGSLSNFSAIVAARRARLPEDFLDGTIYVTDQVHASVAKSAVLAGFPQRALRVVPRDAALRMEAGALREMVLADREGGRRPFLVVASAGTTNTGAIDPLSDIAGIAGDEGLWLHVDGAYGGLFQLTDRGRAAFAGIQHADSIAVDPHKTMFLPYGTGALLVRDGRRLREAHSIHADYLQDLAGEEEIPNFTDYSPELSRDFRGLRLWLPIKLHGLGAFRAALNEKLDLARFLFAELQDTERMVLPWEPQLSVVAFRLDAGSGNGDDLNRRFLEAINASRRVFLSSTLIDGRFVIRACIVSHRTHRDRIEEAAEIVRKAAAILA
jgi:aromatic-L-amino-acid decarboxylase